MMTIIWMVPLIRISMPMSSGFIIETTTDILSAHTTILSPTIQPPPSPQSLSFFSLLMTSLMPNSIAIVINRQKWCVTRCIYAPTYAQTIYAPTYAQTIYAPTYAQTIYAPTYAQTIY